MSFGHLTLPVSLDERKFYKYHCDIPVVLTEKKSLSLTLQKMSLELFHEVFQQSELDILSQVVTKNPSEHYGLNTNHNGSLKV